jgi:hypothetical protein
MRDHGKDEVKHMSHSQLDINVVMIDATDDDKLLLDDASGVINVAGTYSVIRNRIGDSECGSSHSLERTIVRRYVCHVGEHCKKLPMANRSLSTFYRSQHPE